MDSGLSTEGRAKNLSFVLLRFPCRPQLDLLQFCPSRYFRIGLSSMHEFNSAHLNTPFTTVEFGVPHAHSGVSNFQACVGTRYLPRTGVC